MPTTIRDAPSKPREAGSGVATNASTVVTPSFVLGEASGVE